MKACLVTLMFPFGLVCTSGSAKESASDPTDPRKFEEYKAMAVKGDAGAQNDLGRCYYDGMGVEKDDVEAVKWYRKAATKLGRPPKLTSETAASSSWKQD